MPVTRASGARREEPSGARPVLGRPDPGCPDPGRRAARAPLALTILVTGGPGAGTSTLLRAVSRPRPLRAGPAPDGTAAAAPGPAADFGRLALRDDLVLHLFGAPAGDGLPALWDDLWDELWNGVAPGALGAVVLAHPLRPADCRPAVERCERRGLPYAVAVNSLDGAPPASADTVRAALGLDERVPVLLCDARERSSVKQVLIALVAHAMDHAADRRTAPVG